MSGKTISEEEYTESETAERMNRALKRALNTPAEHHQFKGEAASEEAAPKATSRNKTKS